MRPASPRVLGKGTASVAPGESLVITRSRFHEGQSVPCLAGGDGWGEGQEENPEGLVICSLSGLSFHPERSLHQGC